MALSVIVPGNKKEKSITVSEQVFNAAFNESLIHQVVTAYGAAGRAGTKAQKTRCEVSGGGRKPWRQKKTGRARAGSIRSPLFRGGGVIFAAKPRDFSKKVNKKMYRGALCSILSELARQGRLKVIESLSISEPKTRAFKALMNSMGLSSDKKTLFIADAVDKNLYLAARNLPRVDVRDATAMDPLSLIRFDEVILTTPVVKQLEEQLK